MNKIDYELILSEINNLKFQDAILKLNAFHNDEDIDYLYLRALLYYKQTNYYLSIDTLINCFQKNYAKAIDSKNILELLELNFISIKRTDLSEQIKNNETMEEVLKKLTSWLN